MSTKVVHYNSIGSVTFFRNRRSKRLKISVKPDKSVLVSFPYPAKEKDVMNFFAKNEKWIIRQQQRLAVKENIYNDGSVLKTKLHTIHFALGGKRDIEKNGKTIKITLEDFISGECRQIINNVLTRVYAFEARRILPQRLNELAGKHNFVYKGVTVRNNKCRWGSCSSKNNISLNIQMMKLPDELIDYILLHELVHTEVKNHGPGFWDKLDQVTNNRAKELAKEVNKYSTYIL
jgi:predicted metal-dependent hydrolase